MAQPYVGEIRLFGGNFAPSGWAFCDGDLLPIATFDTLFALIGTTYGGDGQTTFALPDLRGRAAIGRGQGPGTSTFVIGESGGAETVTLTTQQLPLHGLSTSSGDRTRSHPSTAIARGGAYDPASTTTFADHGGGQPHENMPPFAAVNFIIALFGVFPSQA